MRNYDYRDKWQKLLTPEIVSMLTQIHEYKGRQEVYLRQKPEELEKLVEIAKRQSTEASNAIEGIRTTSTRLKQLCEEKTTPKNRDEEEILGYRDVLNTIHRLRPSHRSGRGHCGRCRRCCASTPANR